jgi:hypothetical protein
MLMTLAVSHPKPLSDRELCDNGGVCREDQIIAARELSDLGLVTVSRAGFRLTDAGERFVRNTYSIVRDGDQTIVEKRDGSTD